MIQKILVPLDGSRAAEATIGQAVAVATGLGAELVLLRVVEGRPALTDPRTSSVDWRLQRVEAEAYLRETAARLASDGLEVGTEVVEGKAADEIVRFAARRRVDLVVLAAYGLGGAREFPLGGTVHKVLAGVPASVMVIRPTAGDGPTPEKVSYRRVLVPVDGSPASEWALCLAASVAQEHGAELLVVLIVPGIELACERIPRSAEETELLGRLREIQHDRGTRYVGEMKSKLAHEGLRVRCRVVTDGAVPETVQRVAAEERADLIAVSAHGAAEAASPYGMVAQRLLIGSGTPVLVFQDQPGDAWGAQPKANTSGG